MKTALGFVAILALLAAPAPAAVQSNTASDEPAVTGIQDSPGELSAEVQLHVDRGDQLCGETRFGAAQREYARAADIARREGHLPSGTSWRLANAQYYAGDLAGGAVTLDKLADEAALVGDLQVEAYAIYYAAWLDGKAGRNDRAAARVARLENLLRSQYLPVATREHLGALLRSSKEVANLR